MRTKFVQIYKDTGWFWARSGMVCCDCGLTFDTEFRIENNQLQMRVEKCVNITRGRRNKKSLKFKIQGKGSLSSKESPIEFLTNKKGSTWIVPSSKKDWITINNLKHNKYCCLDCGLVHDIKFRYKDTWLQMQVQRNGLSTGGKRTKKSIRFKLGLE